MKRIIISAVAALLVISAGAQDLSKAKELYEAGMYSQAMASLDGVPGEMAEGYRTLCALSMGSDGAYAMAGRFVSRYPECILTPQVRFLWGIDLFDQNDADNRQTDMLHARIQRLQPFDRAIVLLWLENMSYDEIAQIVGINVKNVSVRLYRIKEQLKQMN